MTSLGELIVIHIDLSKGQEWVQRDVLMPRTEETARQAAERYGPPVPFLKGDALDNVDVYMEVAMRIVRADPEHVPMIHLYQGETFLASMALPMHDRSVRTFVFSRIADEVMRYAADSLLLTIDSFLRAAENPGLVTSVDDLEIIGELIEVIAVRSDGAVKYRGNTYARDDDEVTFTPMPFDKGPR
jgi:hypothetical protein